MLKQLSATLAVLLTTVTACTDDAAQPRRPEVPNSSSYAAVQFFDGDVLSPEYRRLPEGPGPETLISVLLEGPCDPGRTTALVDGIELVSAAEAGEGLLLEMNDAFWDGSGAEIRQRAAQLVFTAAGLEEGKEITFLEGLTPGRLEGPDGRALRQPVTRDDFPELQPWIQVAQPVAGALVADPIPIRVDSPDRIGAAVQQGGARGGVPDLRRIASGIGFLDAGAIEGDAVVVLGSLSEERLPVLIPVELP